MRAFANAGHRCLISDSGRYPLRPARSPHAAGNAVNKEGMSRLPKRMQQAKRVAPPAVPEIYRHSGSSFGSAGYGSCDDTANTNVYANDPNASLNVSLRSNASNNSIDLTDSASSRANASGE